MQAERGCIAGDFKTLEKLVTIHDDFDFICGGIEKPRYNPIDSKLTADDDSIRKAVGLVVVVNPVNSLVWGDSYTTADMAYEDGDDDDEVAGPRNKVSAEKKVQNVAGLLKNEDRMDTPAVLS